MRILGQHLLGSRPHGYTAGPGVQLADGPDLGQLVGIPQHGRFERFQDTVAEQPFVLGDSFSHPFNLMRWKVGFRQYLPRRLGARLRMMPLGLGDIVQPRRRLDHLGVGPCLLHEPARQAHDRLDMLPAVVHPTLASLHCLRLGLCRVIGRAPHHLAPCHE